ncbi:MAG: hypothetical protein HWD61_12800 [Parachlamydiaceae bacterium]|nr:MAG: hypothetical protein HWD61_12800 [Parachlamydiaceae bacterium]
MIEINQNKKEWPEFVALFEDEQDLLTDENLRILAVYLGCLTHEMTHMKEKAIMPRMIRNFSMLYLKNLFLLKEDYENDEILSIFNEILFQNKRKKQSNE